MYPFPVRAHKASVFDATEPVEPALEELLLSTPRYTLEIRLACFPEQAEELLLVRMAIDGGNRLGSYNAVDGHAEY